MIDAKIVWHGDETYKTVLGVAWESIRRAAVFYFDRVQDAINTPNTGRSVPFPDDGRWGTRTVYPNPSKPGEPPHKITSQGSKAVQVDYDEPNLTVRVGIRGENAKYMLFLELGTRSTVNIVAKAAKALAIFVGDGRDWVRLTMIGKPKQWIFRRSVTKYPQKPHPFLLPTLKKYWTDIAGIAEAEVVKPA